MDGPPITEPATAANILEHLIHNFTHSLSHISFALREADACSLDARSRRAVDRALPFADASAIPTFYVSANTT